MRVGITALSKIIVRYLCSNAVLDDFSTNQQHECNTSLCVDNYLWENWSSLWCS